MEPTVGVPGPRLGELDHVLAQSPWLQFEPKSEPTPVHRLTSTWMSCISLPLATQETCATQSRPPLLLATVNSIHHRRGQGTSQALIS